MAAKTNQRIFRSFQQYKKAFYPSGLGVRQPVGDAYQYGVKLARKSLRAARQILTR